MNDLHCVEKTFEYGNIYFSRQSTCKERGAWVAEHLENPDLSPPDSRSRIYAYELQHVLSEADIDLRWSSLELPWIIGSLSQSELSTLTLCVG